MTTIEIRKNFLEFFAARGHQILPGDSLVPKEDPTVLFTTAGMQQFKKQFLGHREGLTKAATAQPCLRTDDLPQVGVTAFHHTFFEMLGNFSFGDYFKKEAIAWAWEFLTHVIQIPENQLWVSVYKDDSEAKDLWLKDININPGRIVELGDKSNFWPSQAKTKGPNGPCGPCSEIFYDYGPTVGCQKTTCTPACDCGRFAEIWNLVFTQYDRQEDGCLKPLPNKNIDTGMGLERLAAVVQGKSTNFAIDLFEPILRAIDHCSAQPRICLTTRERYVIADHIRAIVFGIHDGVIPSNEGRGYVIKKLITDITDLLLAKTSSSFIFQLVPAVVEAMHNPYQGLVGKQNTIAAWIQKTEEAYQKVRNQRIPELRKAIEAHPRDLGKIIFTYRDTYGLSLLAVQSVLQESSLPKPRLTQAFQEAERLMEEQREKSRAKSKMTGDVFTSSEINLSGLPKTRFLGYDTMTSPAQVLKIVHNKTVVSVITAPAQVQIVLDQTPFYPESGGQVGDTGILKTSHAVLEIQHTSKMDDIIIHQAFLASGQLMQGESLLAEVNSERRRDIMCNHTATHLLQAALRTVLGNHVQQQGSLVEQSSLRFDFTHPKALSQDEIHQVEDRVNAAIRCCTPVTKDVMSLQDATAQGALAFFAEKYQSSVRVVTMGDQSQELCGGTHLNNTGEIGLFKILHESAIAQGIRRIEAATGRAAITYVQTLEKSIFSIAEKLKAPQEDIVDRLKQQLLRMKELEKKLAEAKFEIARASVDQFIAQAITIHDAALIFASFDHLDIPTLRKITDLIKLKTTSSVIVLGSITANESVLLVAVSESLLSRIQANTLISHIVQTFGGSGGGRPQLAQAGCQQAYPFHEIITATAQWIRHAYENPST